jgi:hypothetical protein
MKQIMLRHAKDDFTALLTASGMSAAGAEVFSITNNGPAVPNAMVAPHVTDHIRPQKFIVWARVRYDAHCDECDKEIGKRLNEQKA